MWTAVPVNDIPVRMKCDVAVATCSGKIEEVGQCGYMYDSSPIPSRLET